jgi:hypothetical protein
MPKTQEKTSIQAKISNGKESESCCPIVAVNNDTNQQVNDNKIC